MGIFDRVSHHFFTVCLLGFVCTGASCHKRRHKPAYLEKKKRVKSFWICAGVGVVCFPYLHVAVSVGLFTTFLSFMYLDESAD